MKNKRLFSILISIPVLFACGESVSSSIVPSAPTSSSVPTTVVPSTTVAPTTIADPLGELYNRIDDVFIFNDIDDLIIEKIIKKKLTDIGENRKIKNFISTEIVEKIKKETNYLTMGARKLDRVVDKVLDELGILSV